MPLLCRAEAPQPNSYFRGHFKELDLPRSLSVVAPSAHNMVALAELLSYMEIV